VIDGASSPPADLPGLEPAWSRLVSVADTSGRAHTWHLLDSWSGRLPSDSRQPTVTVLCVHGNPTWSYLWRRLLATAPRDWRVVAPDQLGMGYSEHPDGARTLDERVRDLDALTATLGITGPVVTVAHDWGGPISLGWAAEHRDQLCGVVLTNTAVHQPANTRGPAVIRLAHLPGVRQTVCARTSMFVRGTTALSRPALPGEVRAAFAAPYAHPRRRQALADFVADIPFGARHPSHLRLQQIAEATCELEVPALLLWGPRDLVFGQPYLDDLQQRMPQAQVHRYEQASHLVPEDAPHYAADVTQWIADLDAFGSEAPAPRANTNGTATGARTLWQQLEARAEDASAAVVEVGGQTATWANLARQVRDVAAGLVAAGVRPGDRVALLVPPSVDLTTAVYAVWRAGGVVVIADKGLGLRGMGRALRGARVAHVIGTAQGLAAARVMRLPGTRIVAGDGVLAGIGGVGRTAAWPIVSKYRHDKYCHEPGTVTMSGLARRGRSSLTPPPPVGDDECAVVFTSGATGPAKGVVYRHRQVAAQLDLIAATYTLRPDDRIVAAFAPFALYGPGLGIASAVPDIDVTAPARLTAAALADAVEAVDATVVFASPAALRSVHASAGELSASQRQSLQRVRLLMSAGAPVPAPLLRSLQEVLPAAEAHTPYGMTEALPVTDISLVEIEAAGTGNGVCVGWPLPSVEVAVSSVSEAADGDLTTAPDVTGEICVRAAHVKDRYDSLWATERASGRNRGWHRTGDVGHLDADGRLWVEGRLQHVLRTAAGILTPVGLEQRVEATAPVRAAAAVGVGPAGAQQVVVVVVPAEGSRRRSSPLATPALADTVRRAAGVPLAAVLVVSELPVDLRHASKVDRGTIARWAGRVLAGRPS